MREIRSVIPNQKGCQKQDLTFGTVAFEGPFRAYKAMPRIIFSCNLIMYMPLRFAGIAPPPILPIHHTPIGLKFDGLCLSSVTCGS